MHAYWLRRPCLICHPDSARATTHWHCPHSGHHGCTDSSRLPAAWGAVSPPRCNEAVALDLYMGSRSARRCLSNARYSGRSLHVSETMRAMSQGWQSTCTQSAYLSLHLHCDSDTIPPPYEFTGANEHAATWNSHFLNCNSPSCAKTCHMRTPRHASNVKSVSVHCTRSARETMQPRVVLPAPIGPTSAMAGTQHPTWCNTVRITQALRGTLVPGRLACGKPSSL